MIVAVAAAPTSRDQATDLDLPVDAQQLGADDPTGGRGPGRPRSAEVDEAILSAAVELLADVGYGAMSMEAVAARAGVSKASLYRRWPGKPQLVTDTLRSVVDQVPVPDTGDVRSDLVAMAGSISHALGDSPLGRVAAGMSGEFARNPELAEDFRQRFLQPRRRMVADVLRRGVERGELRADLDLELVLDVLAGALYYRTHVSGGSVDERIVADLVDLLLDGLRPA